jgi:hypothetical protein
MMDIVEQLRKSANTVYSQDGYTFRLGLQNEAADEIELLRRQLAHSVELGNGWMDEIERLREWIRHIGYYVSRNEVDPTPTEKYIQKVCASALKKGE